MTQKIKYPISRAVTVAVVASIFSAIYWFGVASDRYVSESHVIIQRTDLTGGQTMEFSSFIAGMGASSRPDQLLLRDYLLSVDMLKILDAKLNLRGHYSDTHHDVISRMWDQDASMEWFHRYYLSRVSIEFDDYSGVLIIKAQGYDAKTAQEIARALVQQGEIFMNHLAQQLAETQVEFLETQVAKMHERVTLTRRAVLEFQDKKGLVSPQATAETILAIVARLEAQRSELQTLRSSLQAYLVANHPNVIQLDQKVIAVEKQIAQEQAKLASPSGNTLNRAVEEFQTLEVQAGFAQDVYKTALVALEKGRLEATRTIKKVSILQEPSLPEYSLEPRRVYNTLVFTLVAMLLAGVLHLLMAIIRDHID